MIKSPLLLLFTLLFLFLNCEKKVPVSIRPLNADLVPADAKPINVIVYNTNSWVEQGKFTITGICTNITPGWQKIWIEAVPLTAAGKPMSISNCASVFISTFSDAVPPSGRTSFFMSWPLSEFPNTPDSFMVKATVASQPAAGPVLVVPVLNSMKMILPVAQGQVAEEKAWQVSGSVSNPLPIVATHPRLEVLIYGSDNLLWLSTVLNPEDPNAKQIFHFEKEGPLQPGEDRPFSLQVYYQTLPQALQEKKIKRVEILPFEARF